MKKIGLVLLGLLALALAIKYFTGNNETEIIDDPVVAAPSNVKTIAYSIVGEYPHDTASYTEGLEFYNGKLYESGGDYQFSVLQYGDAKSGKIEGKNKMGTDKIFAEGITILNDKLYQLTYTSKQLFVYNVSNINKPTQTLVWPFAEGWGLTNNGVDLLATTGTDELYSIEPATLKVKSSVHVHDDNGAVSQINELEYVDGFVYANIYQTNNIVKIDPSTGAIVGKMNFNNIDWNGKSGKAELMNGIAYNRESKTFFITGKRWPKMYEIRLN
jgi:glutaminyl-peptide cyclotransferase